MPGCQTEVIALHIAGDAAAADCAKIHAVRV